MDLYHESSPLFLLETYVAFLLPPPLPPSPAPSPPPPPLLTHRSPERRIATNLIDTAVSRAIVNSPGNQAGGAVNKAYWEDAGETKGGGGDGGYYHASSKEDGEDGGSRATAHRVCEVLRTKEGLSELKALFADLDQAHDGRVSGKEWGRAVHSHKTIMSKYFGGHTEREIGAVFRTVDVDGSHDLSWDEFVAAADAWYNWAQDGSEAQKS